MHGTRDAALDLHQHYIEHLLELGPRQETFSPCLFHREGRGIRTFIHGDGCVSLGKGNRLKRLAEQLPTVYERKVQALGFEPQDEKLAKVFNRIISWSENGEGTCISYVIDPRHAELIVREGKFTTLSHSHRQW